MLTKKMTKDNKVSCNSSKHLFFDQPLVSVIVATYRRDSSLRESLESLIEQTYRNIEIIVVDDNACVEWNKKTLSIVTPIKESTEFALKYIRNETNQGSAESRNIGISNCQGQYVTFLDDDDIYLKNKIEKQLNYMLENNADFCITDLKLFSEEGRLIDYRRRSYLINSKSNDLLRLHLKYHMTGTDTMMFKKDYLVSIGSFEKINVGDEFFLMIKAIKHGGKFCYLATCDVKAFVHEKTSGLSSGEEKIIGEKNLYAYKKTYFSNLLKADIGYVTMRHYAVIAYAYLRMMNYPLFLFNTMRAFYTAPLLFLKLIIEQKKISEDIKGGDINGS